jgi:hypothetical protein
VRGSESGGGSTAVAEVGDGVGSVGWWWWAPIELGF